MPKYTQENRPFKVKTPLGPDELLLAGINGQEHVSQLFRFTLDLLSENKSVSPDQLLGQPVTITIVLHDGAKRYIHGVVCRFTQHEQTELLTAYKAEVVPWLWFLTLSSDCRIFQTLSVPDILEKVFKAAGYSNYDLRLVKKYPTRDYCVQYRETDFAFVSRLMEAEGLFYFFEHEKGKHTMVIGDGPSAVHPTAGQETARMAANVGRWQDEDVVTGLIRDHVVHTGKVALRDYNFEQPSLDLETKVSGKRREEAYDYPGNYLAPDDGARYARLHLEAREALQHHVRGESTCRAFVSGSKFELTEHYRADANGSYMLLSVTHHATAGDYRSWDSAPLDYHNEFVGVPSAVPYRPPIVTPRALVHGTQTAVVVGPAGEEIYVDKYGRVKVQFFWDREGKKDESSSCWIRVSTTWAGSTWGFIQIPRIGQEVVVDFLEGNPDRPLITGSVYNAQQVPAYPLPANKTRSGVKSRSSQHGDGTNFNEIRFEDKKGSEEVYIHAEKDQNIVVEHDRSLSVGHDHTTSIKHDESHTIGNDQTASIARDRTESVGRNETITIDGNRTETVAKDESVSISGSRSLTVEKDDDTTIEGKQSLAVSKDQTQDVKGERTVNVGKDDKLAVAKILSVEAGDEITFKTGEASITMKKNGDITIKGNNINLEGSGKIVVKASSDVVIKGSKVTAN
jgi:type VI secretion system secreted protein VgrG